MEEVKSSKSLEETFQKIEEIIEKMEEPDITLEDSFTCYQKGMEELKYCNQILDKVEKKMQIIHADGQLGDFEY